MIEEYKFGSITIDEKTYNNDVEVHWGGEVLQWQTKESHIIDVEDVRRAVEKKPEIIIIGIGESGLAKVTKEAEDFIKEKGIGLIIDITEHAVKRFNVIREEAEEDGEEARIIGLFHLTC